MPFQSSQDKFIHELADTYDAEHQFLKAMQDLGPQAKDSTLKQLVEKHIGETETQIKTLEQVFQILGEQPKRQFCDAAKGIVTEGQKTVKEAEGEDALKDTVIVAALDKSEHYEIASYSALKTDAELLGKPEVVKLLDQNFQQEWKTSEALEKCAPTLAEKAQQAEKAGSTR